MLNHKVLITEEQLKRRLTELGKQIAADYEGKLLTVISVMNGSLFFTADLLRNIDHNLVVDCIRVSSYKGCKTAQQKPELVFKPTISLKGSHVLIIDDILDTGNTLTYVRDYLINRGAQSVKTCVLLDKTEARKVPYTAEYVGFRIPNLFVVGYGLDLNEHNRHLPYIVSIDE